jgi:PDZ domain-containing protein
MGGVLREILRWLRYHIVRGLAARPGHFIIIFDASFVLLAPVSVVAIALIYVPIVGAGLNSIQAWGGSFAILALMFLSFFLHSLAHIVATRAGSGPPRRIFFSPLGDPAHFWPAAPHAGKEALIALAGPLIQGLLAAIFYALWNLQINIFANTITFFLVFFNLGLMAVNLIPAFPFDGGRLVRAIIWRLLGLPGLATRLALRVGWGIAAGSIVGYCLNLPTSPFSP